MARTTGDIVYKNGDWKERREEKREERLTNRVIAYLNENPNLRNDLRIEDVLKMQNRIATALKRWPRVALYNASKKILALHMDQMELKVAQMTKTLCEMLVSREMDYDLVSKSTAHWLGYIERCPLITSLVIAELFPALQTVAKFVKKIGCHSIQARVVENLFRYLSPQYDALQLFDGVVKPSDWICAELKTATAQMHRSKRDTVVRRLVNFFNFESKQVVSKTIRYLFFDDEEVIPYSSHSAWMDWNRGTKTVEFSLSTANEEAKLMTIKQEDLQSVHYKLKKIKTARTQVIDVTFVLKQPLRMNCESDASAAVKEIRFHLSLEFELNELEQLLQEMFPDTPTMKIDGDDDVQMLDENDNSMDVRINGRAGKKSAKRRSSALLEDGSVLFVDEEQMINEEQMVHEEQVAIDEQVIPNHADESGAAKETNELQNQREVNANNGPVNSVESSVKTKTNAPKRPAPANRRKSTDQTAAKKTKETFASPRVTRRRASLQKQHAKEENSEEVPPKQRRRSNPMPFVTEMENWQPLSSSSGFDKSACQADSTTPKSTVKTPTKRKSSSQKYFTDRSGEDNAASDGEQPKFDDLFAGPVYFQGKEDKNASELYADEYKKRRKLEFDSDTD